MALPPEVIGQMFDLNTETLDPRACLVFFIFCATKNSGGIEWIRA